MSCGMVWRDEFTGGTAAGLLFVVFSFPRGGFLTGRPGCTVMRVSMGELSPALPFAAGSAFVGSAFAGGLAVPLAAGTASLAKLPPTLKAPATKIVDRQKPSRKLFSYECLGLT